MMERVEVDLVRHGPAAMLLGAFSGSPYKIYAVKAGALGISPTTFLVASVPARLARFALVCLLVQGIAWWVRGGPIERWRRVVLVGVWIAFYAFFFTLMPN